MYICNGSNMYLISNMLYEENTFLSKALNIWDDPYISIFKQIVWNNDLLSKDISSFELPLWGKQLLIKIIQATHWLCVRLKSTLWIRPSVSKGLNRSYNAYVSCFERLVWKTEFPYYIYIYIMDHICILFEI